MDEKVLDLDQLTKCAAKISELKSLNESLDELNRELEARLADMHGEYLKLRNEMEGMASQGEVLALRKKILELQNELRLKRNVPQEVPTDHGPTLVQDESRSAEDAG